MKKFIALLLSCTLVIGIFAGCGGDNGKSGDSTVSSGATQSNGGDAKKSGGPITFPYTGEPIVFNGFGYDFSLNKDPNTAKTLVEKAWKEHIGNISINWKTVPYSDFEEKVKVYLNSGDIPDVLPVLDFKAVIAEMGETGMFLNFNKYTDCMPNLQKYREKYPHMDNIVNGKGERLAIMGVNPTDYTGEGWQVNKTILDECNVAIPNTFDELMNALRSIKAKKPDVVPFQTYWNLFYTQVWFASAMNARDNLIYFDEVDKKWEFAYREKDAKRKELIETMATLYKEGLINKEIATMSNEQEEQQLTSGKWAFFAGYNNSVRSYFKADEGGTIPFDLQYMLPPKADDGKRYIPIAYIHDSIPGWGFVCSSKVKNPEYLAAYMDEVVSPFGRDNFNFGIEGVTYDIIDGEPTIKQGIDLKEVGIKTQYEVWMVGMNPEKRITKADPVFHQDMFNTNLKALDSGEMVAYYQKGIPIFMPEEGAKRASYENDLKTYIEEQEAKFIYGNRPMSEWDDYVKSIEKFVNIDELLNLYNKTKTIDISGPRIWTAK